MRALLLPLLPTLLLAQRPGETVTTRQDQRALAVTIYNGDLALVKDQREVALPKGAATLAFEEVSTRIRPETALLRNLSRPEGFFVLEQNFDFDLLTPARMLEKAVGRKVTVVTQKPNAEGPGSREVREEATVLSTHEGVVLQFKDRVETTIPGRIVYDQVPPSLRPRPTLLLDLQNADPKPQKLELSYLTKGLGWKADYVASLSPDERRLDLNGWVTLTNTSGVAYPHATLQLVAGNVHRVIQEMDHEGLMALDYSRTRKAAAPPPMQEEGLFEYHLYTLPQPTTLGVNQTKQVALLAAASVPVRKAYELRGEAGGYTGTVDPEDDKVPVTVLLSFDNKTAAHLGMPIPKGVMRVYKRDIEGRAQFVGEDAVDHTPKDETVKLNLGHAFDVTAHRKQTDFRTLGREGRYDRVFEVAFQVELRNAKAEPVTVAVKEPIPGEWTVLQASQPPTKEGAHTAVFQVAVPAGGKTLLTYRVKVKQPA